VLTLPLIGGVVRSYFCVPDLAPRDDIESLAFIAFFLLRGNLPWKPRPRQESQLVSQEIVRLMKMNCQVSMLSTGFPDDFGDVLTWSRSLEFGQLPDYKSVRHSFALLATTMHLSLTYETLDWTPCPSKSPIPPAVPTVPTPKGDDKHHNLGKDSYCEWDVDIWSRQGEREKDLTLPAKQKEKLDRITPRIVEVQATPPSK
jgi:hypothetical protein